MKDEEIFYKKVGDEFVPIKMHSEDWYRFTDGYPINTATLTVIDKNCTSRRYNVEPDIAPLVAATMLMESELSNLLVKMSEPKLEDQPRKIKYTKREKEAWDKMCEVLKFTSINLPSHRQVAERILKVISDKAIEIMKDKDVADQYEQFLTLVRLKNG